MFLKNSSSKWTLTLTGGPPKVSADFHPLAREWLDVEVREKRLGIGGATPVLVSGTVVDDRLNAYFRQAFGRDRSSSKMTFAIELRTWMAFLDTRGLRWDEARPADVRSFQLWRVYEEQNPGRVTPATWNKGWAALRHFYQWASREKWVESSPVGIYDRLRPMGQVGGHREKNARTSRDRWLTPVEYAMWRDIGLRGYGATRGASGGIEAGFPCDFFRGRNLGRNAAFTDFLLSTGLRKAEAGSLLEFEVPDRVDDETPIVGKGGTFRHYRVMQSDGLESIRAYVIGERRDVIRKAQRSGRYSGLTGQLIVAEFLPAGKYGQRVRLTDGRILEVPRIGFKERMSLYLVGANGMEPASLWLTDAGAPMPHGTWNFVFNTANTRVSAARTALGERAPRVRVTPHSLRFSFALMVLVAGVRATDDHLGLGPASPFFIGNYSHVFDEVRDLLGHASVETTRRIYLEPVKGLRRSSLFSGTSLDEVWGVIAASNKLVGFGDGA